MLKSRVFFSILASAALAGPALAQDEAFFGWPSAIVFQPYHPWRWRYGSPPRADRSRFTSEFTPRRWSRPIIMSRPISFSIPENWAGRAGFDVARPMDCVDHYFPISSFPRMKPSKPRSLRARQPDCPRSTSRRTRASSSSFWLRRLRRVIFWKSARSAAIRRSRLARALPADGKLLSLEADPKHAEVARANIAAAGLLGIVEIRLGKALDTLPKIEAEKLPPFDFIFIDADKANLPDYFAFALKLAHRGSLIVVDNVVREGRVIDATNEDPNIKGVRRMNELIAAEPRVSATAVQTVGSKGYDGFALLRVIAF